MNDRFDVPSTPFDLESPLAPYAAHSVQTRDRIHTEPPSASRTESQRDRDHIIHSTAFHRLEYETQIFVNHEGDLFRTRLTHNLEVARIVRSIARSLRLNEDLVEAVSLAHGLGHTPFGHARQDTLNDYIKPYGGFEHSLRSLLVVDWLEERYGGFDGLNLTFETREGILKHCSRNSAVTLGDLGHRFLEGQQPSLETQLASLADEVACNNRDIGDGPRSGLITLERLEDVPLWAIHRRETEAALPDVSGRHLINETIRRIINALTVDLISTTRADVTEVTPQCVDDVRAAPALVAFSAAIHEKARVLKRFLFDNLYRHYLVMRMSVKARYITDDLFRAFMNNPRLLSPQYQAKANSDEQPRWIAHYIADMTDRYAIEEHHRIFAVDAI